MRTGSTLYLVLLLFPIFLSACGGEKIHEKSLLPPEDPAAIGREESLESESIGIMEGRTSGPMLPVYFGYDSYTVRPDQVPRMKLNAYFLKEKMETRIRIEGNCDPRGTREYNLALGEKRALGAKKYLVNMGVSPDRIGTVSLGEEKILFHGYDEMAWAQNRRGDFVIE